MSPSSFRLTVLGGRLAICRLAGDAPAPTWAAGPLASVTRTADELSVVAPEAAIPPGVHQDPGWRALRVEGPLDLSLTGVLAALAGPLAEARLAIFAVSTFDTDYLLVREADLARAEAALTAAGHQVQGT